MNECSHIPACWRVPIIKPCKHICLLCLAIWKPSVLVKYRSDGKHLLLTLLLAISYVWHLWTQGRVCRSLTCKSSILLLCLANTGKISALKKFLKSSLPYSSTSAGASVARICRSPFETERMIRHSMILTDLQGVLLSNVNLSKRGDRPLIMSLAKHNVVAWRHDCAVCWSLIIKSE